MSASRLRSAVFMGLLSGVVAHPARAQSATADAATTAPSSPAPAPPTPAPSLPTPAPSPPSAATVAPASTAAPAAPPAIPPGYMLVPIPAAPPAADTRYDVQYPQSRGALPPGMELPYEDGDPIPPGYRVVKQKRRGLIIAGSIVTGVPWVLGVTAAAGNDFRDNTGLLLIPVLGPWALLATDTARDGSCSSTSTTAEVCTAGKAGVRGVLVLDGIVQLAGGTMFAAGMFFPRLRLVRKDVTVSVVPTSFGHGGYGLGAAGRF